MATHGVESWHPDPDFYYGLTRLEGIILNIIPVQTFVNEFVEKNWKLYDLILTHDSILLKRCPNAKLMYWGSVWDYNDVPKTKMISMLCSKKDWCELHHKRIEVANAIKNSPLVDCYGDFDGGNNVDTYTAHAEYMYAVAIENYVEDYWFTEKIFNCFANKTIPIYYGSPKITEFFNPDGIIIVNSPEEIVEKVNSFSVTELNKMYYEKIVAINDNYNRVRTFDNFFDRLYMMYHREFGL